MIEKSKIIKTILGIAIFLSLFFWIGVEKILATLTSFNLIFLAPATLSFLLVFFINALNLKILLSPIKKLEFAFVLKNHIISWCIGSVLPTRIGEFSFSYLIRKKIPIGKSSAILLLDKIVSLMIFVFLSSGYLIYFFGFEKTLVFLLAIASLFSVGWFFIISETGRGILKNKILKQHQHIFKGFSKTLEHFWKKEKKLIVINSLLTTLRLLVQSLILFFLFKGFGLQVDILFLMFTRAAITVISLIPLTPGGLGVRQGSLVFLLGLIGVPYSITMGVSIICMAILYTFVGFVFYFSLSEKILSNTNDYKALHSVIKRMKKAINHRIKERF